jgi:hypothetical protein
MNLRTAALFHTREKERKFRQNCPRQRKHTLNDSADRSVDDSSEPKLHNDDEKMLPQHEECSTPTNCRKLPRQLNLLTPTKAHTKGKQLYFLSNSIPL